MGFLDKILAPFATNIYKGTCRAMINSYNKVKQQNPNLSKRELYALTLSLRPTYKREDPSSYTFHGGIRGENIIVIEQKDTFRGVVRKIIYTETTPSFSPFLRPEDPKFLNYQKYLVEVEETVNEEFKDFKE